MRGKDWSDPNLLKRGQGSFGAEARLFQARQSPAQRTRQGSVMRIEFAGAAPALAMVGLGKICQLKISGKRFCHLVCVGQVEFPDNRLGLPQQLRISLLRVTADTLAMIDKEVA